MIWNIYLGNVKILRIKNVQDERRPRTFVDNFVDNFSTVFVTILWTISGTILWFNFRDNFVDNSEDNLRTTNLNGYNRTHSLYQHISGIKNGHDESGPGTLRDSFKDNFRNNFRDNFRDNFEENFCDNFGTILRTISV